MPTIEFLREKARQCRELMAVAKAPEVRAQLELWAREFEEAALEAESIGPSVFVVALGPMKQSS
jgi:hypothetical protein